MQETSEPPTVHLAVPVTNPVPPSVAAQHLCPAAGSHGLSGAPDLLLRFSAERRALPEGLAQLLGLDYRPLQLSPQCSLPLSPSSAAGRHLLPCA